MNMDLLPDNVCVIEGYDCYSDGSPRQLAVSLTRDRSRSFLWQAAEMPLDAFDVTDESVERGREFAQQFAIKDEELSKRPNVIALLQVA